MSAVGPRSAELPSNAWGDTAFHLANAARSLEAAAHDAVSQDERMLATRIRRALGGAREHVLARAYDRAEQQEAMTP